MRIEIITQEELDRMKRYYNDSIYDPAEAVNETPWFVYHNTLFTTAEAVSKGAEQFPIGDEYTDALEAWHFKRDVLK